MHLLKSTVAIIAALGLVVAPVSAAYADSELNVVQLPDGSQVAFATNSNSRLLAPSTAQSAAFHCNPACTPITESAASGSGALAVVAGPLGNIGAAAVFGHNLPGNVADNTSTTVTQTGASANQTQDQVALADGGNATNVNAPTTNNVNVPVALGGQGGIGFGGVGLGGQGGNAQVVGANSCNTAPLASGGCQN